MEIIGIVISVLAIVISLLSYFLSVKNKNRITEIEDKEEEFTLKTLFSDINKRRVDVKKIIEDTLIHKGVSRLDPKDFEKLNVLKTELEEIDSKNILIETSYKEKEQTFTKNELISIRISLIKSVSLFDDKISEVQKLCDEIHSKVMEGNKYSGKYR